MVDEYRYGMRLRGFSPGTFPPFGFVRREDDPSGNYYDILVYDVKLTDEVIKAYELDYLPTPEQRIDEIAVRLDKVYEDIDPYNYRDYDGSVELAKRILKEDPYTVIEELIGWLEEAMS